MERAALHNARLLPAQEHGWFFLFIPLPPAPFHQGEGGRAANIPLPLAGGVRGGPLLLLLLLLRASARNIFFVIARRAKPDEAIHETGHETGLPRRLTAARKDEGGRRSVLCVSYDCISLIPQLCNPQAAVVSPGTACQPKSVFVGKSGPVPRTSVRTHSFVIARRRDGTVYWDFQFMGCFALLAMT